MEGIILLNAHENTRQIEDEEKNRFVKTILETLGLPIDGIWDEQEQLSIEGKIKLRNILSSYGVNIIDDMEGGLQIFFEREVVARWEKPTYTLKKDHSQIDPTKKLFLQMAIKNWSIFEQNEK